MQIHRFRDCAAIALAGNGETRYMTAPEAEKAAKALLAVAASIRREKFHESAGLTVPFTTAPEPSLVAGNNLPRGGVFLFRRGDGNDGNFKRMLVELPSFADSHAALGALLLSEYQLRHRVRRYIARTMELDGESDHPSAMCLEGPDGESAFGAAWLTAELEPVESSDVDYLAEDYGTPIHMTADSKRRPYKLREAIDDSAWRYYLKESRRG